eukprot:g1375.t1
MVHCPAICIRPDVAKLGTRIGEPADKRRTRTRSGRLQSQLSCTPQRATLGDTSYKAAFWAQTEQNYCVDIPPDAGATAMTDLGLSEICKSFCGENAIPLTIGGDGICLAGDIIEANSSFVSQCHTHARAMQNVQIKLAAFVSSLRST